MRRSRVRSPSAPPIISRRSLQVLVEPLDGAPRRIDPVLALGKTVAFVRVVMDCDGLAVLRKDVDDLLRFLPWNARVVISLQHQQRRLDAMKIGDGGGGVVRAPILHRIAEE